MIQYDISGMSCAACQARVEKAVSKVEGVTVCSVNLLTNSMGVEGTADSESIIRAVEAAGYGASLKGAAKNNGSDKASDSLEDHETPALARRLIASIIFLIVLMYFSMGHMMLGLPVPGFLEHEHMALGLIQMVLSGIVLIINQRFFISGFKALMHASPNMDTLIALGSGVAYGYSVVMLIVMSRVISSEGNEAAMPYLDELYFESAAMILTLITVGKMLEAYSKGRTTDALKDLMSLAPQRANVIRDGVEVSVAIEEVSVGDMFTVRAGETIPVDGIITEGTSAVNEAALTGESIPVDKSVSDEVSGGTINMSGFIICRASRVGEDTTLSKIISLVSDASATKAPVAKLADRISGVFVPVVIAIAFVTIVIWLAVGADTGYALARGITVLVVSCPCALGLATPVAIMVGSGVGARNGILYKTAEALQETGRISTVALDKTGTVTVGKPKVCDIIPPKDVSEEALMDTAFDLETKSEHPLAGAIVEYALEHGWSKEPVGTNEVVVSPGNGLTGNLPDGTVLCGGNAGFIDSMGIKLSADETETAEKLSSEGKTLMYFARKDNTSDAYAFMGMIAVADTIREDSAQAIADFKALGIKTVMLTGDNARTAQAIAAQAGVDQVISEVRPDGKDVAIRSLQREGKVAMIGDGINDAPALTRADIGIAIGAGTDVAIDSADVVLMKSSLSDAVAAVRLSRRTYLNIKENLFWALIYNVLLIPAAAGVYAHLFGITMNPMLGAAAMSLSSFCVVTNALRLNLVKIYDGSHDRPLMRKHNVTKEEKKMQKTMKIGGMMCEHCEARVKKALEAVDGVVSATVSHEKGTAVVELESDVSDETLSGAVTAQDYEVKGIE